LLVEPILVQVLHRKLKELLPILFEELVVFYSANCPCLEDLEHIFESLVVLVCDLELVSEVIIKALFELILAHFFRFISCFLEGRGF